VYYRGLSTIRFSPLFEITIYCLNDFLINVCRDFMHAQKKEHMLSSLLQCCLVSIHYICLILYLRLFLFPLKHFHFNQILSFTSLQNINSTINTSNNSYMYEHSYTDPILFSSTTCTIPQLPSTLLCQNLKSRQPAWVGDKCIKKLLL